MKRGTPHHPKTLALAALLEVERCVAVGLLEGLFHWAGSYARRGDVGRHSDAAIAAGLGTSMGPDLVIESLVTSGWLDRCECHRLRIHDWPEHADQAVERSSEVKAKGFLECYATNSSEPLVSDSKNARAYGIRQTADGTGHRADGGRQERSNPLVDRVRSETRFLELVREIAPQVGLDPTEVARKGSAWNGRGLVNPASMSDDRLAHSVAALEAWARKLNGQVEPELPASRAAPSPRAQNRVDVIAAGVMGGLKEHERGELGQGVHGTVRRLPGSGHDA